MPEVLTPHGRLTRRSVLLVAGAAVSMALSTALVAACDTATGRGSAGAPTPSGTVAGADLVALERARARIAALTEVVAASVDDAGGSAPALAAMLAGQAREVGGVRAAGRRDKEGSPSTTSTSPEPSGLTPTASPTAGRLPTLLVAAATAARADLPRVSPGLARLLAALAAADVVAAGTIDPGAQQATPAAIRAPGDTARSTEARALAVSLAVEQACVYGYGVLAVRQAGQDRSVAASDLGAHTRAVDALRARLREAGRTPSPGPPGWALPFPVVDAPSAQRLALRLERASASAAADLVAASAPASRSWAASALTAAALRAAHWRSATGSAVLVAAPGLSDRPTDRPTDRPSDRPTDRPRLPRPRWAHAGHSTRLACVSEGDRTITSRSIGGRRKPWGEPT